MVALHLLVEIGPDKQMEFLQSIKSLLPESDGEDLLLHSVDDHNLFYLMLERQHRYGLNEFMQSTSFRTLMAAITVLGAFQNMKITEDVQSS